MKRSLSLILALVIMIAAISLSSCGKEEAPPETEAATEEVTTAAPETEAPSYESYPEDIVGAWNAQTNIGDLLNEADATGKIADSYAEYGVDPAEYEIVWHYEFGENGKVKISIDEEALKDTYLKMYTDMYEYAKTSGTRSDEELEMLEALATPESVGALVDGIIGSMKEIDKTETYKYTFFKDQLMFSGSTIRISIDGDTMEFIELMSPLDEAPLYLRNFPVALTRNK